LLIIVDFIDAAQEQEIRIDGLTVESDVFQKIIVYKPIFEHLLEITPQPRSARRRNTPPTFRRHAVKCETPRVPRLGLSGPSPIWV
jgi:hypothetical protein